MELEDGEIADDRMLTWSQHNAQYIQRYSSGRYEDRHRRGKNTTTHCSEKSAGRGRIPPLMDAGVQNKQKGVMKHSRSGGRRTVDSNKKAALPSTVNARGNSRRKRRRHRQKAQASSAVKRSLLPPAAVSPPSVPDSDSLTLSAVMTDEDEIEVLDPPTQLSPPVITLDDDVEFLPLSSTPPLRTDPAAIAVDTGAGGGLEIPLPPTPPDPASQSSTASGDGVPRVEDGVPGSELPQPDDVAARGGGDEGVLDDAFADADDDELELRLMALQSIMKQTNQRNPAAPSQQDTTSSAQSSSEIVSTAPVKPPSGSSPNQSRSASKSKPRPTSSSTNSRSVASVQCQSSSGRSQSRVAPPASSSSQTVSERTGWLTERVLQETSHSEQCRVFVETLSGYSTLRVTVTPTADESASTPPLPQSPPPLQPPPPPPLPPPSPGHRLVPYQPPPQPSPVVDDDEDVLRAELLIDMSRRCVTAQRPIHSPPPPQQLPPTLLPTAPTSFIITVRADESDEEDSDSTHEAAAVLDRQCFCDNNNDNFLGELDSFLRSARAKTDLVRASTSLLTSSTPPIAATTTVESDKVSSKTDKTLAVEGGGTVSTGVESRRDDGGQTVGLSLSRSSPSSAGRSADVFSKADENAVPQSILRSDVTDSVQSSSVSSKHVPSVRTNHNGKSLRARVRKLSGRQRLSSAEKQAKSAGVMDILPKSRVDEYMLLKRLIAAKEHERQLRHRRKRVRVQAVQSSDSLAASNDVSEQTLASQILSEPSASVIASNDVTKSTGLIAASDDVSKHSPVSPLQNKPSSNAVAPQPPGPTARSKPSCNDVINQPPVSAIPPEPTASVLNSNDVSKQPSVSPVRSRAEVSILVSNGVSAQPPPSPIQSQSTASVPVSNENPDGDGGECGVSANPKHVVATSSNDTIKNGSVSKQVRQSVLRSRRKQRRVARRHSNSQSLRLSSTLSNCEPVTNSLSAATSRPIQAEHDLSTRVNNQECNTDITATRVVAKDEVLRTPANNDVLMASPSKDPHHATNEDSEVGRSRLSESAFVRGQNCTSMRKMKARLLQSQLESTSNKLTQLKQRLHGKTVLAKQLERRVVRERSAIAETRTLIKRLQHLAAVAEQRLRSRQLRYRQLQRRQLLATARRRPEMLELQHLERQCSLLTAALDLTSGVESEAVAATTTHQTSTGGTPIPSASPLKVQEPESISNTADSGKVSEPQHHQQQTGMLSECGAASLDRPTGVVYTSRWRNSVLGSKRRQVSAPEVCSSSDARCSSVTAVDWCRVWPLFLQLAAEDPEAALAGNQLVKQCESRSPRVIGCTNRFTPYHTLLSRHRTRVCWNGAPHRFLCQYHLLGRCSLTGCSDHHLHAPI